MNYAEFIDRVREAGVVGQGGAGFPSHVKYAAKAETVIVNGCECEPLLATDQWLMVQRAAELMQASAAVGAGVGATACILAVKKKNAHAVAALRAVPDCGVELRLVEDFYPAGDEQSLIRIVLDKCVPPLAIPAKQGVLVTNVGTLLAAWDAREGKPVIRKVLTVAGAVARPSVLEVPVGTSVAECLQVCGGATVEEPVCILGGPIMGKVAEQFSKEVVTKTLSGVIVVPAGHPLHANSRQSIAKMRKAASAACIQCRFCTDLCPRYLNGQDFETHKIMRAFAANSELTAPAALQAFLCCECGVCELMACPMALSPRRINIALKNAFRTAGLAYTPDDGEGDRSVPRSCATYRQMPSKRLAIRMGLGPYLGRIPEFLPTAEPESIRIPLRQHIGSAAVPVVTAGDRVQVGDLVAEIAENALGARIHAGMSGEVTRVDASIHIRRISS